MSEALSLGGALSVFGFSDRRTQLGTLVLDVLITEEIDLAATVTRFPVEDGSIISDHITAEPETLRISGLVSTADVLAFGFLLGNSGGATKLVAAIDQLRAMHKARALVTISTGQMQYSGYAFTSLNAVRSADRDGGNWLSIQAELVKVAKVVLKTADVPPETAQGSAKGRAGKTATAAGKAATTVPPAPAKPAEVYGPPTRGRTVGAAIADMAPQERVREALKPLGGLLGGRP